MLLYGNVAAINLCPISFYLLCRSVLIGAQLICKDHLVRDKKEKMTREIIIAPVVGRSEGKFARNYRHQSID